MGRIVKLLMLFLLFGTYALAQQATTAETKDPLPPLTPIADTSEYLKLTPKLTNEEFQQFLARAEKGEPLAMDLVFFASFSGFGTPCDFNAARNWLVRGNRAGAPVCRLYHGRNLLGFMLNNCQRNEEQGKVCVRQAQAFFEAPAQNGNAAAQFFVGAAYHALKDPASMKWYEKSSEQGFASAQTNLGNGLSAKMGDEKAAESGLRLLRMAADQGMQLAMSNLYDCYRRRGDQAEALRWLRTAADRGHPVSCFKLSLACMSGQGVDASLAEAHKWLLKAAEAGFAEAMPTLGMSYRDGFGVAANRQEAQKWFLQAAALGTSAQSATMLDKAPNFLSMAALSAAERLTRDGKQNQALEKVAEARQIAVGELGTQSENFARLIHKIGHVHIDLGDFKQGEALHLESVASFEAIKATDDLNYVEALMCTSYIDETAGRLKIAEDRIRTGLAILQRKFPPKHPQVLDGMTRLASVLRLSGRFLEALKLLDDCRAARDVSTRPLPDQNSFWVVYSRTNMELRRMPEAEEAARKCIALNARLSRIDERFACNAFDVLAEVLQLKGQYAEARDTFLKSLETKERLLGKNHFLLAETLVALGLLDKDYGRYDLAEESLRRAQQLCSTVSVDFRSMAYTTQALATLLANTGRFSEAETLYRSALELQEKAGRPGWGLLNNFGNLLEATGRYAEADRSFRQALLAAEEEYGPEHAEILTPLSNVASLCGALGRCAEQKALLERRLDIATKVCGPDHIDSAWAYLELSYLARDEERYAEAIDLQKRALTVFQKCYGDQGIKALEIESVLAETYIQCGRFTEAETILRRALTVAAYIKGYTGLPTLKRKLGMALQGLQRLDEAGKALQNYLDGNRLLYGTEQMETAYTLQCMAYLQAATSRDKDALNGLQETERIQRKVLDQVGAFSSEEERVQFAGTQVWTGYALLSLCLGQMADDPTARSAALDLLLRRQGAVLAEVQRERLAAREAGDPALAEAMTKRQRLAATLSHLTLAGPGNRDPKDYQAQLEDLRKQINELEAEWARKSSAFREQTRQQTLTASDIQKVLPADAAFVQIAAYRQKNFKEVAESKTWGPRQYAALILTKDSESPTLVKLGAADPIEKAIAACRDATQKMTKPGEKTAGDDWLKAASDVRRLVWDPLTVSLKDRRKVYLVPDGELNFVAFGTLPLENGKFLLEERDIALLSNGRDLLRETIASKEGTVLALAAPEFGGVATAQEEVAVARGLFRSHLASRAGFDRLGAFNPLPGTLAEAKSIEALCKTHARKVEVHTGAEATEARLKSASRPAVLHLATHGFFLPEPDDAKKSDSAVRNALLRSGLALAGANRILKGEAPPADQEDGLVTAEEITGLDLWGTKLVVLSACQTALGESRGGEGVFGLRRAFLLAGAEHLVMSLWSVPDKETQELMTEFYKRHLGGGSTGRALREAQLEYLRRARAENRSTHPFYWGAFVHTGIGIE